MIPLQAGMMIGPYTLMEPMGRGASGEVWQATGPERTVAMKFMHADLLVRDDHAKHRARFAREVWALEHLRNLPHIPVLYGSDLNAERPYFVMQCVPGDRLDTLIASGQVMFIPLQARLDFLETLANALTLVHLRGIIHRDIKPANIIGIDNPFLMDFSVAVNELDARHANPDVGTGLYLPPPDGQPPDKQQDVYAFALVAYEVLFGQHAVIRPTASASAPADLRPLIAERLRGGKWHRPSTLTEADLPVNLRGADLPRLDAVFGRALGPRDKRYKDVRDLVVDLRGAVMTPANVPYLDALPSTPPTNTASAYDDHYTLHEVQQANPTNHEPGRRRRRQQASRLWLVIAVLAVAWLIGLALLVLSRA